MQLLQKETNPAVSSEACARQLLETIPLGIRLIRKHMRRHRSGLTVAQFRTLCFLTDFPGSSLSAAADFVGLSLPAMSRLVDGLVDQKLMERKPCSNDRRQVRLSVTDPGQRAIAEARGMAQAQLARAVTPLSLEQRAALIDTLQVLREIFEKENERNDDCTG